MEYLEAMKRMDSAQRERIGGRLADTVFYLEHEHVVTFGRATPREHLPAPQSGLPCIEVPRGGLATYHGPGQLVGYCVMDLSAREGGHPPDLHEFLRAIEEGLIGFLQGSFGLSALRREGYTGVWIDGTPIPRKLASIGISVRRWVTSHGFALNVANDLDVFREFVPCGIPDAEMTSVDRELRLRGENPGTRELRQSAEGLHGFLLDALRDRGWCAGQAET